MKTKNDEGRFGARIDKYVFQETKKKFRKNT